MHSTWRELISTPSRGLPVSPRVSWGPQTIQSGPSKREALSASDPAISMDFCPKIDAFETKKGNWYTHGFSLTLFLDKPMPMHANYPNHSNPWMTAQLCSRSNGGHRPEMGTAHIRRKWSRWNMRHAHNWWKLCTMKCGSNYLQNHRHLVQRTCWSLHRKNFRTSQQATFRYALHPDCMVKPRGMKFSGMGQKFIQTQMEWPCWIWTSQFRGSLRMILWPIPIPQ